MGYTRLTDYDQQYVIPPEQRRPQRYLLHTVLFLLTFVSCVIAGVAWQGGSYFDVATWQSGVTYAVLIMLFISAHEFGHYIAARRHGVDATLPFYIPMPFPNVMPFGTFGAVIRTRSPIMTRKVLFDIGAAGPLAGFVVCIAILIIGLVTLPSKEHLYQIHPEYLSMFGGEIPSFGLTFGDTIIFTLLAKVFANPNGFLPPMNEIYHYPFLCVGWFGLFVTALNLLPVGQLDGGHITYAMFGEKQRVIARLAGYAMFVVGLFALIGSLREFMEFDSPDSLYVFLQDLFRQPLEWLNSNIPWIFSGWFGWLMWAILARFLFGFAHPPLADEEPLDRKRMMIGWIAIAVFVLSISLNGIYEVPPDAQMIKAKRGSQVVELKTDAEQAHVPAS